MEWTHENEVITINPHGMFVALGYPYPTLEAARDAIHAEHLAHRKVLHCLCLTREGVPIVVTGLNLASGALRTDQDNYDGVVYPDVPWIREVLAQHAELKRQAHLLYEKTEAIEKKMAPFKIHLGHGRKTILDLARLEVLWQQNQKAAEKLQSKEAVKHD